MAAKKPSSKKSVSKSAFVRSLPATISGAEAVKKAKEAGLTISLNYVYSIRARSKSKPAAAKRGPGRPKKSATAPKSNGPVTVAKAAKRVSGGLVAEIEAIVERKLQELLKAKLGVVFA